MLRSVVIALVLRVAPCSALLHRQLASGSIIPQAMTKADHAPSDADVARLREKLNAVVKGLEGTISKSGGLAHSKVTPALQAFVDTLRATLNQTTAMKDPVLAMNKLQDAKAGISGLVNELTNQQEKLMKGDEAQKESLLLGVLMTRQQEPMAQQLRILGDEEFAVLDVSRALLAHHDPRTPLYQQVAKYMDAHPSQHPAAAVNDKVASMMRTAANLEARADALQLEKDAGEQQMISRIQKLNQSVVQATGAEAQQLRMLQQKLTQNYHRWSQLRNKEIEGLRSAVVAMRSGDVKALELARSALVQAVKALQAQTGGFLHFLQIGHQLSQTDCPYCAAQCLEKCHASGKPYVSCLGECADAGKGK